MFKALIVTSAVVTLIAGGVGIVRGSGQANFVAAVAFGAGMIVLMFKMVADSDQKPE